MLGCVHAHTKPTNTHHHHGRFLAVVYVDCVVHSLCTKRYGGEASRGGPSHVQKPPLRTSAQQQRSSQQSLTSVSDKVVAAVRNRQRSYSRRGLSLPNSFHAATHSISEGCWGTHVVFHCRCKIVREKNDFRHTGQILRVPWGGGGAGGGYLVAEQRCVVRDAQAHSKEHIMRLRSGRALPRHTSTRCESMATLRANRVAKKKALAATSDTAGHH